MIVKFKEKFKDKYVLLGTIGTCAIIGGTEIPAINLTHISFKDGEDISQYLTNKYYISKRNALYIDGVTETKLSYLDPHQDCLGTLYNYKLDDVINIISKTVKELK